MSLSDFIHTSQLRWVLSNFAGFFPTSAQLSNFKLSNLKLSNFSFFPTVLSNYTHPKKWHDVTYQKRLVNVCFYVESEKFHQKGEVYVFFHPYLLELAHIVMLSFFSRIQKHFHCHFLAAVDMAVNMAVDVAVGMAVEWFFISIASGSRTIFGFYCQFLNGSRISKWQ